MNEAMDDAMDDSTGDPAASPRRVLGAGDYFPDLVLRHVHRDLQVVTTARVLAARLMRGCRQRAEAARRALVVHHHVLVQVEFGCREVTHRSTFSARSTPASRRSTSAWVL